jgi:hypothetical protein
MTCLIAMQKVVGSNPISRFFANPLHVGGLGSAQVAETKSNYPRISSPFWALVPKMPRMRGDFGIARLQWSLPSADEVDDQHGVRGLAGALRG